METLEIKEVTDFAKARRNPYARKIKENGFSITVHYSPEDAAGMIESICNRETDFLELDADELSALERYRRATSTP
ncbi:MAG: hypothetical protein LBI44_05390 [Oscillospiraceae bacterium]|jgi:phage replication-related protein YjqB (UPF0714/DUF867 family)|nr:hypothetical protein [Oscillospiraceae bacterium]